MSTPSRLAASATAALLAASALAGCSTSSVMDLSVEDCFILPNADQATTIEKTDCSEAHSAEVFYTFEVADTDFPGLGELGAQAETRCVDNFEAYVGSAYVQSSLDVSWYTPTEESWKQGDREIVCLAVTMDGSDLTRSVEDSGL